MARKSGLGRGLDALIPSDNEAPVESGAVNAPIEKVIPNPRQPRMVMQEEELHDLANSIREHGILQPLVVTYDGAADQYILIAGERRLRAAKLAGLDTVPVLIRQVTEQERLELALIENLQRADLSPLETAEAFRQLAEVFGLSHEEIAVQVGKSRVTVTNTLRLLKLPEPILNALSENAITEGHARALLGLPTPQAQLGALQTILNLSLNVRQTEALVRKLSGEKPPRPETPAPSGEVLAVEDRLRQRFGTKVTLRHGQRGGTLTIHYYSNEELDSLIHQLLEE